VALRSTGDGTSLQDIGQSLEGRDGPGSQIEEFPVRVTVPIDVFEDRRGGQPAGDGRSPAGQT
jgi:hypothetical protein